MGGGARTPPPPGSAPVNSSWYVSYSSLLTLKLIQHQTNIKGLSFLATNKLTIRQDCGFPCFSKQILQFSQFTELEQLFQLSQNCLL